MIETLSRYAEHGRLQHPSRLEDFEALRFFYITNAQLAAETP